MKNHLSPHDRLFRTNMAKPKVAKEFFKHYLPEHIKNQVNLDSIELQKEEKIMTIAEKLRTEGRVDTSREIALRLLKDGMDPQRVTEFTDVPESMLRNLQVKM